MSKILTRSVFPLLIISLIAISYLIILPSTRAAADTALVGYVWSSNIGWISLNCDQSASGGSDDCEDSNYSVILDSISGVFSGYAWSSNIGWIDFAPTSGYPQAEAPAFGAKVVAVAPNVCASEKEVQGWVRAVSPTESPYFGSGWDGWIKMSGNITGDLHYGICVTNENRSLSGWAWGGDVVGWIQFNFSGEGGMPSGGDGGSGTDGGSGAPGGGSGGNDGTPHSDPAGAGDGEGENSIEKLPKIIEILPR